MNKFEARKKIAEALRGWREKAGKSQKEVADALEIKAGTYRAYELAYAEPSVFTLKKMANVFGLDSIEMMVDLNQ